MDVMHGVFVVFDVADGVDALLQAVAFGQRGAHAEVVRHGGVDAHDAGFVRRPRAGFVGVDRHQVHAHRRLARLVAAIVAVHRRHPVEHFALRVFARRRGWGEPAPDADASRQRGEHGSANRGNGAPRHDGSAK